MEDEGQGMSKEQIKKVMDGKEGKVEDKVSKEQAKDKIDPNKPTIVDV